MFFISWKQSIRDFLHADFIVFFELSKFVFLIDVFPSLTSTWLSTICTESVLGNKDILCTYSSLESGVCTGLLKQESVKVTSLYQFTNFSSITETSINTLLDTTITEYNEEEERISFVYENHNIEINQIKEALNNTLLQLKEVEGVKLLVDGKEL